MIVERDEGGENGDTGAGNAEKEPSAILFNSPALPVDGVHGTLEEGGHGGQLVGQSPSCGECPPIIRIPILNVHCPPLYSHLQVLCNSWVLCV